MKQSTKGNAVFKIRTADDLSTVLRAMREVQEAAKIAHMEMSEADQETQDVLHELELNSSLTYRDRAILSKTLTGIRQRRRAAKDTLEMVEKLSEYIGSNNVFMGGLQMILGEMRKTETRHQNRTYTPRGMKNEKQ